jgi:meiotic recombination protein SPO11
MGDFRLIRGPDVLIDMQSAMEDTLIPRVEDGDDVDIARARWVLVIEKEV